MAPTKAKPGVRKGKPTRKPISSKSSAKSAASKGKGSSVGRPVRAVQQKTKPILGPIKKKKRVYSEKELGIPKLNMITPAGVQKHKGKKKGKVFVDDQQGMMTILAMVNADKEGQIESKMIKERQMEEIRQARQAEMEARQAVKKSKLDETKNELRRSKKRKPGDAFLEGSERSIETAKAPPKRKKQVSFG